MRHWTRIEDPCIDPPEVDECDECGWEKGTNDECITCVMYDRAEEDAAIERGRREPEY